MKKLFAVIMTISLLTAIMPNVILADNIVASLSQERMNVISQYLDSDEVLDLQTVERIDTYLNIYEKVSEEEESLWRFATEEERLLANEKFGWDIPSPSEITDSPEEFEARLRQMIAKEKVLNAQAKVAAILNIDNSSNYPQLFPLAASYHTITRSRTQNGLNGTVTGQAYDNNNNNLFWHSIDSGDCASTPAAVQADGMGFISDQPNLDSTADGGRTAYVTFTGIMMYPDGGVHAYNVTRQMSFYAGTIS